MQHLEDINLTYITERAYWVTSPSLCDHLTNTPKTVTLIGTTVCNKLLKLWLTIIF